MLQEFKDTFYEGKELAEQSEILEQPEAVAGEARGAAGAGNEVVDPEDLYYGRGGEYSDVPSPPTSSSQSS